MKGKLYNPYGSSSPAFKWKNAEIRKSKNKILYIWDTSIPETWKRVSEKQKIMMIKVGEKCKNTLQFLEETQRYINNITKPVEFEERLGSFDRRKKRQNFPMSEHITPTILNENFSEFLVGLERRTFFRAESREPGVIRLKKKQYYSERPKKSLGLLSKRKAKQSKEVIHKKSDIFSNF